LIRHAQLINPKDEHILLYRQRPINEMNFLFGACPCWLTTQGHQAFRSKLSRASSLGITRSRLSTSILGPRQHHTHL